MIEAGLGGRLDATNVIPSKVTALTSISLEHTELLGDTEAEIAREKLAVLRRHSTLVLGTGSTEIEELAERVAAERAATLVGSTTPETGIGTDAPPLKLHNFAVASAAVRRSPSTPDAPSVLPFSPASSSRASSSSSTTPHPWSSTPPTTPAAPRRSPKPSRHRQGRPVVACIAMLEGKDIQGFAQALSPALSAVVCTQLPDQAFVGAGRPGSHSVEAGALAAAFDRAGASAVVTVPEPEAALAHARRLAGDASGLALATGTHYLLPYIWTGRPAQNSSR